MGQRSSMIHHCFAFQDACLYNARQVPEPVGRTASGVGVSKVEKLHARAGERANPEHPLRRHPYSMLVPRGISCTWWFYVTSDEWVGR